MLWLSSLTLLFFPHTVYCSKMELQRYFILNAKVKTRFPMFKVYAYVCEFTFK